ncbi:MAG TPA: SCO family protein [Pirellulaceae bacterium]|nr:SCO family protein [Pirellulaceae bacterium]
MVVLLTTFLCSTAAGQVQRKNLAEQVGLDQRLGEQVPLHLAFRDETGKHVRLGDYFHDKPVIMVLVQYRCPMLCTEVLNGFLKSSQAVQFQMGRDYEVVTVSIDPRETPPMAAEKKRHYAGRYRRQGAEQGWHFLTGDQQNIDVLAKAIGYRYRYDKATDQYAHPSGIVLATPGGRLARYFYGIEYHPSDLRLGLVESSENRIGSPVDQVLLLCFHYDPATGKYGLVIAGVLRLAALATVFVLGGYLSLAFYREFRQSKVHGPKSKVSGLKPTAIPHS